MRKKFVPASDLQKLQQQMFHDLGSARRTEVTLSYLFGKYRTVIDRIDGENLADTLQKAIKLHYQEERKNILDNRYLQSGDEDSIPF